MSQSVARLLAHIIFSTKNREPLIVPEIEGGLFGYIHGIVKNSGSKLIIANGAADHVHLLISMARKFDLPKLIGDIKRDSSVWIKKQDPKLNRFYWQRGYGAFTIGESQLENLVRYIENQKDHHQRQSFQDEFRMFLKKYNIDYDETYIWD